MEAFLNYLKSKKFKKINRGTYTYLNPEVDQHRYGLTVTFLPETNQPCLCFHSPRIRVVEDLDLKVENIYQKNIEKYIEQIEYEIKKENETIMKKEIINTKFEDLIEEKSMYFNTYYYEFKKEDQHLMLVPLLKNEILYVIEKKEDGHYATESVVGIDEIIKKLDKYYNEVL